MKIRLAVLGVLTMTGLGCGGQSELEKVVVSGTVARSGQPMPKGRITLFPIGDTKGPVSGAEIKQGAYRIDIHGGVPVGKHRVAFHEVEVDAKRDPTLPPPLVENNILPAKFNDESKLEVEVKSGSKTVTLDFDLDKEFGPIK